jgi:hypothetical protein
MKKYKIIQTIGWLFITLQFAKYFGFDLNIIRKTLNSNQIQDGFDLGKVLMFNSKLFVGIILITISNKKIRELERAN